MKLSIKNIFLAGVMGVFAVFMSSCSDWTKPESLEYRYVTLEEKNPELYEAYFQSIRDYRASDHKVTIAKFDNRTGAPSGRADHISCLPDSVDFIILKNADAIDEEYVKPEIASVRADKGQKVLYEIVYSSIVADYKAYKAAWDEEHKPAEGEEETEPAEEAVSLDEFVRQAVALQKEYYTAFGYDGVNIVASFLNPASCNEEQLVELEASQEAFLGGIAELVSSNEGMTVLFEGTPHYLVCHEDLVDRCDYIIIPAESAANSYACSYEMELMMRYGNIPTDRFILGVTTKSIDDPSLKNGSFSGTDRNGFDKTAIIGGAEWVMTDTGNAVKAGLCVDNAQNDYFNLTKVYYNIREAISIMNPSPIK